MYFAAHLHPYLHPTCILCALTNRRKAIRKAQQLSFINFSIKIPNNNPLKIPFDSIDFSFIFDFVKDKYYKPRGAHSYNLISLFKALLLIDLGIARSEKDFANKLRFNTKLAFLCGLSFGNVPSHTIFHHFRNRLGRKIFFDIFLNLKPPVKKAQKF
ncbi:MAG: hypothetical protein DRQ10_05305 [Candidatus Hydrothermota bacterium]|nr:MAG: hypothetical protein DRQ10_05305 [Candidatus Hydrothermae bacterium]